MAIPGNNSGEEVIKHFDARGVSSTAWITLLTCASDHIYTIKSIIITNTAGTDEKFTLVVTDDDSNTKLHYLFVTEPVATDKTFIWNDVFAISGTTKLLRCLSLDAANFDVWGTYIMQNWS